ncbi:MAG TPA: hypothetical protein DCR00_11040, partial [Gammaproteobacteria bacterium]|nr:hypothetical protein [Gammaproteobacteria bacterium]
RRLLRAFFVFFFFFFKQKTAYEIGLGIPAEPLFRIANIKNSPLPIRQIDEWGTAELKLGIQAGLDLDSARNAYHFVSPHGI